MKWIPLTMVCWLSVAGLAHAQVVTAVPKELDEVAIVEHRNEMLPLDLAFTNEDGETVHLGDYFRQKRPVLLSLNYYGCPMLCGLQLNGMVEAFKEMDWVPGDQFEVVTVSINPRETHKLASLKKQNYINAYGSPEAARGWHFLTGQQAQIDSLAQAVGFEYEYLEDSGEYSHAAVAYVATPEGLLSRYLYGVVFDPKTLRYSLVEAGDGHIGTPLDQVILYCFHYDASAGHYTPVVMNIMRAGALLCLVLLGALLSGHWWREHRRRRVTTVGVEL
ncbi:MAG: SCO family protein [Candidatus Eisenbacteria bacterium]